MSFSVPERERGSCFENLGHRSQQISACHCRRDLRGPQALIMKLNHRQETSKILGVVGDGGNIDALGQHKGQLLPTLVKAPQVEGKKVVCGVGALVK